MSLATTPATTKASTVNSNDALTATRAGTRAAARPSAALATLRYAGHDTVRHLRMFASVFFITLLPTAMYLMFGAMTEFGDFDAGSGNVKGSIMVSMAVYGAIVATTNIAGSAAVEQSQGWGRLLAMTSMSSLRYVCAKVLVALVMAVQPVVILFAVGYATGAKIGSPAQWLATFALTVGCSVVFALYGLAFGLFFRSESALGAASGLLVILAFFGNLFTPLTGTLLEIARFTPIYGVGGLARWPQLEGAVLGSIGTTSDSLTWLLANVAAWTLLFGAACMIAMRRRAVRR